MILTVSLAFLALVVAAPLGGAAEVCPEASRPRALLLGDSNIYSDLGRPLEARLSELGFLTSRFGKPTSGMARPDFFDWIAEAPRLVDGYQPDVVIMLLGGNDAQWLAPYDPEGRRLAWSREGVWRAEYQRRVRELATTLIGDGPRQLLLLGPTNRRPKRLRERMSRVRAAQSAAVEGLPGATWIDTFDASSGANGRWLFRAYDERGRLVRLRRRDGIHFTPEGGEVVASRLVPALLDAGLAPPPEACARIPRSVAVLVPQGAPRTLPSSRRAPATRWATDPHATLPGEVRTRRPRRVASTAPH